MAEAEEGEFTENEISEEEEEQQEAVVAQELEQVAEENEVLLEELAKEETEEDAIEEAENEEEGMEPEGTEKAKIEEKETTEEETEEGELKDEEKEADTEDNEAVKTDDAEADKTLEKPPDSVALRGKIDDETMKKLEKVEKEVVEAANKIYVLKGRAEELIQKEKMTEIEEKELEEVNAELKKQMDLFDEKTKEIQDIIANTNILETMPARLPQAKHEEDVLPKVILCGLVEEYVPKIVVCDNKVKGLSSATRECMPACPGSSSPPVVTPPPKKCFENCDVQHSTSIDNAELEKIKAKLEKDISSKDKVLDDLKLNLVTLKNEIKMVSNENTMLTERIKKLQLGQARQNKQFCEPKKMCPSLMSAKLLEYSDYTRKLEKQLAEMERDFNTVHREICAAQKERECLEQTTSMKAKPFCNKK